VPSAPARAAGSSPFGNASRCPVVSQRRGSRRRSSCPAHSSGARQRRRPGYSGPYQRGGPAQCSWRGGAHSPGTTRSAGTTRAPAPGAIHP
jgi:hypothetical protein